uniref:Uncharacterized protein n=1 Tax=Glossina pallidipes TaxID=7398 RepID=A0A1B0A5T6_GLOPL
MSKNGQKGDTSSFHKLLKVESIVGSCCPQLGSELLVKCAPNTKCDRLNRLCEVLEHSLVLSKDDDEICDVTELGNDDELYGGVLSALLKLFSDKFSFSSNDFIGTVVMAPSDLI